MLAEVTQHESVTNPSVNAMDNNPATIWKANYNSAYTNLTAYFTFKFKIEFQIDEVVFTVGKNQPQDGMASVCVVLGDPADGLKSCSPADFGLSGYKEGDKLRWFELFGKPKATNGARRRRQAPTSNLDNPVTSVSVTPASDAA